MKFRLLLAVASVAALGACNSGAANNSSATANTAAPAASGAPAAPAAPAASGTADAATISQLQMAAQQIERMSSSAAEGAPGITGARVEGNTLITAINVPVPLDANTLSAMQQQMNTQTCSDPRLSPLSRAGATFAYDITDGGGQVHRVSMAPCP